VRSPGEFSQGHIIGAVNIPLFSDEERAIVGTAYKRHGKDQAVLLGLEFVGPKMADIVRKCHELSASKHIRVHCWRGGMRSQSVAWLLKQAGFNAEVLPGGYKGYKQEVREFFEHEFKLIVLGGPTGSGKTIILHQLKALGQQVVDLEGLANHKGSSFGSLGQEKQPSTDQFENLVAYELQLLDSNKMIWIEDESRKIGTSVINAVFWEQMHRANRVLVHIPMEKRLDYLVKEYGVFPKADLASALSRIGKRLGPQHLKAALELLEEGNLTEVAKASLEYYDKAYAYSSTKRLGSVLLTLESETSDAAVIARNLISAMQLK
jgi:tRNA 2-selenouridine synthase